MKNDRTSIHTDTAHEYGAILSILSRLADDAGLYFAVVNEEGVLIRTNRLCIELLGGKDSSSSGKSTLLDLICDESKAPVRAVLSDTAPGSIQTCIHTGDGDRRTILWHTASLSNDQNSNVARVMLGTETAGDSIHTDIPNLARRRKTETFLYLLENVAENISDSIIITDTSHTIIFVNQATEVLFGHSSSELLGKTPDFINTEFLSDVIRQQIFSTLSAGHEWSGCVRNTRRDGSQFVCEVKVSPVTDDTGAVIAYMGIQKDITDEQKARDALKQSKEKYRSILKNINDGYYEVDLGGNFTSFNDAMSEIIGYPPDDMIGMNNRAFMSTETAKRVFGTFHQVYQTGQTVKAFDWELIRRNNEKRFVEVSVSLLHDGMGRPAGFSGIARDITERKRLEEQLLEAQKMEAIGTLAGGIAHDFNNILASILGFASHLKSKTAPDDDFYKGLSVIEESAVRASGLTSKLLAYSQKGIVTIKTLNLNKIIADIYDLSIKGFDSSISCVVDTQKDLKNIRADESQLHQVVMNLVINARDAMPDGGTLSIKTEMYTVDRPKQMQGFSLKPGEYVMLTISDSGMGMSEETRTKMFDPYFTTKGNHGGAGLGMSVVYGIVKSHDGYIYVGSIPGVGTTISVYFPATDLVEQPTMSPAPSWKGGSETILIVDDESSIVSMLTHVLTSAGYSILSAHSGTEGLRLYEENIDDIDLVILDIIMPDIRGDESLTHILDMNPSARVILSSGFSKKENFEHLLKHGTVEFIGKPFSIESLLGTIRSIL